MKEEQFPHTRKPPHWQGHGGSRGFQSHRGEHSNKSAEGKAERSLNRELLPTSTHQPDTLICSPAREGGGWELRFRLQMSDPRERTGVGCVKTA